MKEEIHTLVVDDEAGVRFFLEQALGRAGHAVTLAADGDEALELLRENRFDLVMVDLRLGGHIDGLRVLESVRWRWPATAVVILTAHGTLDSALAAIREGIDGYLLKPVEPEEVRQAAQQALERRRELSNAHRAAAEAQIIERGEFMVDVGKHLTSIRGEPVELTPQEFDLLVHLMCNAAKVISPPELVRVVRQYEPDHMHEARQIIKWYVHRLRRKVELDPSNPRHILNVRGVGYRFKE